MLTEWAALVPFHVSEFIAVLAFASCAIFLAGDDYSRMLVRSHWRLICLAVVLVVVFRVPLHGTFFHGTEYEDSYVYSVAGRESPPSLNKVGSPYLVQTCVLGNLRSCDLWQTYSGHYIGYPAVLRLATPWLGDSPALSNWVNFFANCVAVVGVFLISIVLTQERFVAVLACIVFASTPIFAIYGMASFAEPFSNACIVLAFYLYLCFVSPSEARPRMESLNWLALTTMLLMAVLVKRENIVLALGLPFATAIVLGMARYKRVLDLRRISLALLSCLVAVLLCASELQYTRSLQRETIEFGSFPFAISNLKALGSAFAKSYILPEWYSCTVVFVLIGLGVACWRRSLEILPAFIIVLYWVLYTTHVRSYYQIHSGGHVSPDDTFRYSMNLMGMWSILAGIGLGTILRNHKRVFRKRMGVTVGLASLYILICYLATTNLQSESQREEATVRIAPAMFAANYANHLGVARTFIVTLEPLVIQMFAPKNVNVVSLDWIDTGLLTSLRANHPNLQLLYLKETSYGKGDAAERYSRPSECLDEMVQDDLYADSHFALMLITIPNDYRGCTSSHPRP